MSHRIERALVTGGAGFVGAHLCEHLLGAGAAVDALDDFSTSTPDAVAHLLGHHDFGLITHDVTEPLPDGPRYDTVFHLASAASPPDYLRRPFETLRAGSAGTENALRRAQADGARFVLASTSEVYGDPQVHPQREDYWGNVNPIGPRSVYDEAKRYAEALTSAARRESGIDTAIARIFNTYGPGMRADDGRMVPTFMCQALSGEPITVAGTGKQTRSLCYVDDTVAGLIALARSACPGPVNLGNPHEITVAELAREIKRVTGSSSPLQPVSAAPDDPRRRCPDISVARRELGWKPEIGLAEGLSRTVEWFSQVAAADASLR